jgi:hypothetical protein
MSDLFEMPQSEGRGDEDDGQREILPRTSRWCSPCARSTARPERNWNKFQAMFICVPKAFKRSLKTCYTKKRAIKKMLKADRLINDFVEFKCS